MTSPTSDETADLSRGTWLVAGASAAAGLIHFSVIAEHSGGQVVVPVGFAVTGVAQVGVAAALLGRKVTRGTLGLAIAINALATAAWVWSRTAGLPFDPYKGVAEAAGTVDVTCVALQAVAITLAVGLLVAPRVKVPPALAGAVALGAVALAAVVVVSPETPAPSTQTIAAATGTAAAAPAAGGDGHSHSHGGAAAAVPAAAGDHSADMLRIDRARCDLGFNPQAYWDEAYAMNVDTYGGGSMTMAAPSTIADVTRPRTLDGKGSEHLDEMISLTTVSSGEGAAAALILSLAKATDDEYDAWRRWVAANPGTHSATPPANGQPAPPSMGHPGPTPWTAMVDRAQCDRLTEELAQARAVSERYPTVADAEAAGWSRVTGYVPGIAAHYMNFANVDNVFEIDKPEMLLFDGNDPDSRIVGLSYYVREDGTAGPTQGFVGENDFYHRHFGLCIGGGGVIGDSTLTEEECAAIGGTKSNGVDGWMSHAWVVPGCESPWGVFSGENPILDRALSDATGDEGAEGCSASEARDRYDLAPGESDLSTSGTTDEASGR
ncbi:MAG TPA: hypothetical protein VGO60_15180 [Iamia sp.]|jgi:hypothetical protein|nr:hypothetical protein [Iamia sp.]